ncbi:MAG: tetratricopeptide repeat protein [Bacteroidales bacterium]|nr:tetratricopeptide repeat protein [Bacteroidales bacterium]
MRNIITTVILLSISLFSYGQIKELNNAYNNYSNGYLDRAKAAIDKAILNDITKNEAKTWMYRGNIYLRLADANDNPKSQDKEYKNLCSNCAEIAFEAYLKAFELDPNVEVAFQIAKPEQGLEYCATFLANDAIRLYEKQKYEEASAMAEKAYKASKSDFVIYIAGITAEMAQKTDLAKTRFTEFVRKKSKMNIVPYVHLANIYKMENDTTRALNVFKTTETLFLSGDTINVDYAVAYSIVLSWAGKSEEATGVMNKALEKDPTNHTLLNNYGSELIKEKRYEEAETYFKRALSLKPNDPITTYNLGNCYYNSFVEKRQSLDKIEDNALYEQEREKSQELLKQAQPYLEDAHKMDPKDRNTLFMLRLVYAELGLNSELEIIKQKILDLDTKQ